MRDPYPAIGERAVGRWGRVSSLVAIALTLYGGCCVFIVLISQLLGSLVMEASGLQLSLCSWMVVTGGYVDVSTAVSTPPPAAGLTPLTWLGTPKDFWGIAVGALLSTVAACALVIVNCVVAGAAMDRQHVTYPEPSLHGAFEGRYLSFLKNDPRLTCISICLDHVRLRRGLHLPHHPGGHEGEGQVHLLGCYRHHQ